MKHLTLTRLARARHSTPALLFSVYVLGCGLASQACNDADDIPPYDYFPEAGSGSGEAGSDATVVGPDAALAGGDAGRAAGDGSAADGSNVELGDAGPDAASSAVDAGGGDASYVEATMSITIALAIKPAPDAGFDDAGDPLDGGGPTATLTITAHDGTTPLYTDLWLYTLDAIGERIPLSTFTSTAARKSPRIMNPATIGGQPSGLVPADDGSLNGVMTATSRGVLDQGAFIPTMNGTVVVTLPAPPTTPILVVGGVEDQRYAGAAVINPDGTPGAVPAGVGLPETHVARSFTNEVKPILRAQCGTCHVSTDLYTANYYLVTGTRDDLVNDNFSLTEQKAKCATSYPDGGQPYASCVQAVTSAQFLVEPGAPAASDLLQRARPDEAASTSALGLLWYGGKGSRYNATYGDRRMPSMAETTDAAAWTNEPTPFDQAPSDYQVLYDWVAQGAPP